MNWIELADSGFWRWYALSPAGETIGRDGSRRISLAVPGYWGVVGLDMTLDDRDGICAARVVISEDWMHDDPAAPALAVDFLSNLLRALEPADALVQTLTATLKSRVGLVPGAVDLPGDRNPSAIGHITDTVLGPTERACARLDNGAVLDVHRNETAVVIAWLAARSTVGADRDRHSP